MTKLDLETRIRKKPHVTKDDIKAGLRELGLGPGHALGFHSSLSSFGYVEGGADAVIDALLETVGPEGAVVAPTYSVNRRNLDIAPEEKEAGITAKIEVLPYDPERAACWTGRIPDTLWRRPGAVRSAHITHSLAAIGARAHELAQAWKKLHEANGFMLLIGVKLRNCSSMHLAEAYVTLPEHITERLKPPESVRAIVRRNPRYWIPFDDREDNALRAGRIRLNYGAPYPDFARMHGPCREHGIEKTITIGESTIHFYCLRELIALYAEYLRTEPETFYGLSGTAPGRGS